MRGIGILLLSFFFFSSVWAEEAGVICPKNWNKPTAIAQDNDPIGVGTGKICAHYTAGDTPRGLPTETDRLNCEDCCHQSFLAAVISEVETKIAAEKNRRLISEPPEPALTKQEESKIRGEVIAKFKSSEEKRERACKGVCFSCKELSKKRDTSYVCFTDSCAQNGTHQCLASSVQVKIENGESLVLSCLDAPGMNCGYFKHAKLGGTCTPPPPRPGRLKRVGVFVTEKVDSFFAWINGNLPDVLPTKAQIWGDPQQEPKPPEPTLSQSPSVATGSGVCCLSEVGLIGGECLEPGTLCGEGFRRDSSRVCTPGRGCNKLQLR